MACQRGRATIICERLYAQLCAAAKAGTPELIEQLVSGKLSFSGRMSHYSYVYNVLIYTGISRYPARPNLNNKLLNIALHAKPNITLGHIKIIRLLCTSQKTDLALLSNEKSALSQVIFTQDPYIISLFFASGVSLETINNAGKTLLQQAQAHGLTRSVKLLTALSGDSTAMNELAVNEVVYPIHFAIRCNLVDWLKMYLEQLNDISKLEELDESGETPLMLVLRHEKESARILLVDKGVNVNAKVNGNTVFDLILSLKKHHLVDKLASMGVDLNASNDEDLNPLQSTILKANNADDCLLMVKALLALDLASKVELDNCLKNSTKSNAKKSPLQLTVEKKYTEVAKLLILAGAKYEDDSALKTQMGAKKIDYVALSAVRAQACHAAQKKQEDELAELAKRQLEVEHSNTKQHQLLPALITRQQQLEQFALMFLGILGNQPVAENGPGGVQQLAGGNQPRLANAAANNQPAPENAAALLANAGLFNQRQPVQPGGPGTASAPVTRAEYNSLQQRAIQQETAMLKMQEMMSTYEQSANIVNRNCN